MSEDTDTGASQDHGQSEAANKAAAAARREERAKLQAMEEENRKLREQLENNTKVSATQANDYTLDFDTLSDPKAMTLAIERMAEKKARAFAAEEAAKIRQEMLTKETATTQERKAARIRGEFKVFDDSDYSQEAEDKLSAILYRHEGEINEEAYRTACKQAAQYAERLKAAEFNKKADDKENAGEGTPPPAGGSAEAMGLKTGAFGGKMTAEERRQKIHDELVRKSR